MGYGLGACIGAKIGMPEKTVVNIAGDGCFRMNMNEIATAASVVSDHSSCGEQSCTWNGAAVAEFVLRRSVIQQPYSTDAVDFAKLAEAMGAVGITVKTKEEFWQSIFKGISDVDDRVLLDCQIDCDDEVCQWLHRVLRLVRHSAKTIGRKKQ